MTEERREKNKANAEKLAKVIRWSFENKDLWKNFCYEDGCFCPREMLDQCLHKGFMELYYLTLIKIGDMAEIGIEEPGRFIGFLESAIDRNLEIDMETLREAAYAAKAEE